jgi:hypothetical protein
VVGGRKSWAMVRRTMGILHIYYLVTVAQSRAFLSLSFLICKMGQEYLSILYLSIYIVGDSIPVLSEICVLCVC